MANGVKKAVNWKLQGNISAQKISQYRENALRWDIDAIINDMLL